MTHVGDVSAVGEKFAPDWERSQRSGTVNVDDGLGVLGVGMGVLVLDAGHEVEGGVADCSSVPEKLINFMNLFSLNGPNKYKMKKGRIFTHPFIS